MATLDEKFLDGPNVGYCSDSDEDVANAGGGTFQPENASESNSYSSPRLGSGVSTGPKGVLADYQQYERERAAERRKSELQLLKEAKRMTLERGGNIASSEDEEAKDNDDELIQIRKQRLKQLRNFSRGRIIEIPTADEFLSILEETKDSYVFIHIYRDGLETASVLNDALLEFAANSKQTAKFFKVKATVLGTSSNFTENALPALQVYRNRALVGNFVRITDELGEDFSPQQLQKFLENHDIDLE